MCKFGMRDDFTPGMNTTARKPFPSTRLAPNARALTVSAAMLLALSGLAAGAQETSWTGTEGSHWNAIGNWSDQIPDIATDTVIGPAGDSPVIEAGETAEANNLDVDAGGQLQLDGQLTLDGNASIGGVVRVGDNGILELGGPGASVGVLADGELAIAGEVAGDVTGDAGSSIALTGSVGGDLETGGALDARGSIDGALVLNTGAEAATTGDLRVGGGVSNAGTLNVAAGHSLSGGLSTEGGGETILDGRLDGDLAVATGGTGRIAGEVAGGVTGAAGSSIALTGSVGGDLKTGGALDAQGSIDGALVLNTGAEAATTGDLRVGGGVSNAGTLNVAAGHSLSGGLSTEGGGETILDGRLDGDLAVATGGTGRIAGEVAGDVTGAAGSSIALTGSVGGDLTNGGNLSLQGSIAGNYVNAAGADATVIGNASAGSTRNAGALTIAAGAELAGGAPVENAAGATLVVEGTLTGTLANEGSAGIAGGTLDGSLSNTGLAMLDGRITGDLIQSGGTVSFGALRVDGTVEAGTDMAIGSGQSVAAGTYRTGAGTTTTVAGLLETAGGLANGGSLALGDGGRVTGGVTGGRILATGSTAIAGAVSDVSFVALGGGGDVLAMDSISGLGTATLGFGIELSAASAASAVSLLEVAGAINGTFRIAFDDRTDHGTVTRQTGDLVLIRAGNLSGFTLAGVDGLVDSSLRYSHSLLQNSAAGELLIRTELDPAIAGVAGSVSLSQSLIGAIVNRPTSPYTVGRAIPDESRNCAPGTWARATGGRSDLSGQTSSDDGSGSPRTHRSDIEVKYAGLQVGTDLSCFNGSVGGWDMAFGVIAGANHGKGTQDLGDLGTEVIATTRSASTANSFDQAYFGAYATASRGRLVADLQLRGEKTDFNLTNRSIGLEDAGLSVKAATLSGALTASIPLGDDGWSVLPTGGFMVSHARSGDLRFNTGDILTIEDHTTRLGFVGAALSRLRVAESGDSAMSYFVTGTYYHDFSDHMQSRYSIVGEPSPFLLDSSVLGSYGEISLGVNYLKVLETNAKGTTARQFNAALRLDGRFSGDLDGIAITGQVRWQF